MKKRFIKTPFTLLEIIVSMAVFSILVVVMMQFFTGARRIWVGTENKNETYSDARAAMNLMSNLLQNTFYSAGEDMEGRVPFRIYHNTDAKQPDKIYFVSRSPMTMVAGTSYNLTFAAIQLGRNSANTAYVPELRICARSDANGFAAFSSIFNDSAIVNTDTIYNAADAPASYKLTVIDRVTNIKFYPGNLNSAGKIEWLPFSTTPGTEQGVPDVIRIELTVIDKEGYGKWLALKNSTTDCDPINDTSANLKFRKPYERKFTRVIYLKSRNYAP